MPRQQHYRVESVDMPNPSGVGRAMENEIDRLKALLKKNGISND